MKYQYLVEVVSTPLYSRLNAAYRLHERLNDFAEDGWRCISCHYSSVEPGYVVVFERVVENNE